MVRIAPSVVSVVGIPPTVISVIGIAPSVAVIPRVVESPRCPSVIPAPCPARIGVGSPHIVPVPRIGPGGGYPCVVTLDIDIPVVAVEEVYVGVGRVAYVDGIAGVVETVYSDGVLVVIERAVEVVEVVSLFGLYIYGVTRGDFVALGCKCRACDGVVIGIGVDGRV